MAIYHNEREQLAQLEWLFQQKKFTEGLARAETVLREFPASFHLKFLKYKFLRELQENDAALKQLREVHALSGDNIMVLKELADMHFQLKKLPESLQYYKKMLFLDSFNGLAQERIKLIQGTLEAGVADRLADTQVEKRPESPPAAPPPPPPVTAADEPPQVRIETGPGAAPAAAPERADEQVFQTESAAELYFKQGLYREALAIYKNLFERTGRNDHFLRIKAILLLRRTEAGQRTIERLQRLLQRFQQQGGQRV